MKGIKLAIGAFLLLAAAHGAVPNSAAAAEGDKTPERSITVSAAGSVTVEPDIAFISAGVLSEADNARDALSRNSASMTKLIEGLKAGGILPKDIQTTTLNVEPRYAPPKDNRPAALTGYRVVNQVQFVIRDLKKMGELVDLAIGLGANQIGRVSFEVSNAEALKDDARKLAVANARARAELYAKAAGVELGQVLRIFEEPGEVRSTPATVVRTQHAVAPIEPGSRTLATEVQVTWALK